MPDSVMVTSPAAVLREALARFGPEGKHWTQAVNFSNDLEETCVLLAINEAADSYPGSMGQLTAATKVLRKVIGDVNLIKWNDDPKRTWPEVKQAFEEAIQLAEREEHVSQSHT